MSSRLLIQMSGAPGAGKSSMSALLSKALNGVVIDHDLLKSGFLEKGHSFDKSAKLTYSLQWVLVEDVIKQGQSVIIDCPCNYDEILTNGINLARKYGYEYKYVECRVSDLDLLDQRLRTRTPLRSQRTGINCPPPDASVVRQTEDSAKLFEKWANPRRPADNVITVETTGGLEMALDYILKQIISSARG